MRSGIAIITSSHGKLSCQFFYIFVAMKQIITFLVAVFAIMSCSNPAGNQDNSKAALDNILSRKSVRSYTEQEVSQEQIETILKAAMAAPSGVNLQPWRFVVVREQATKEKLAVGFNKMIAQAPVAIVVCGVTTPPRRTFCWRLRPWVSAPYGRPAIPTTCGWIPPLKPWVSPKRLSPTALSPSVILLAKTSPRISGNRRTSTTRSGNLCLPLLNRGCWSPTASTFGHF